MKEITVDTTVENIQIVTDFIDEQLEMVDLTLKEKYQINIAIDELFGNIVHYAYYPKIGTANVQVQVVDKPKSITITFIDQGVPYNPIENKDPDVTLSLEERGIGGLGIFMAKKCMDDISYKYEGGKNILQISKKLS